MKRKFDFFCRGYGNKGKGKDNKELVLRTVAEPIKIVISLVYNDR
jgi:hypothetical protein